MEESNIASKSDSRQSLILETIPCKICGRSFVTSRIKKHEAVCLKARSKQRPVFDAGSHRVQGTDAQKFYKPSTSRGVNGEYPTCTSTLKRRKSNWQKQHEDFIEAVRTAKRLHYSSANMEDVAKMILTKDEETLRYKECPHCLRRFNSAAAGRHIPKCALMIHNKTKR